MNKKEPMTPELVSQLFDYWEQLQAAIPFYLRPYRPRSPKLLEEMIKTRSKVNQHLKDNPEGTV